MLLGQGDGRLRYIPSEELAAQVCFAQTYLSFFKKRAIVARCCKMFQGTARFLRAEVFDVYA